MMAFVQQKADQLTSPGSSYARPPIIETVIELRFREALGAEELARVSERFGAAYPDQREETETELTITPDPTGRPITQTRGTFQNFLRASQDQWEALVLKPAAMAVVDRAPYAGWSAFFDRFKRDWRIWTGAAGSRQITRIGMRTINRIDIPMRTLKDVVYQEDYVKVHVQSPEDVYGPTSGYEARAVYSLASIGGHFLLRTTVLGSPPPVPGHLSVLLDFDLVRETDPPQNENDLMTLLATMRVEKNKIFEAAITEKARELFR